MTKLSFSSSKNKDTFYVVRMDIPDDFFMLETDEKIFVFLDSREYGAFVQKNTNPHIEAVLLNPFFAEAEKIEGKDSLVCKLLSHILTTYVPNENTFKVSAFLPLPIADYLRARGFTLTILMPFRPARAIKEAWEVEAIKNAIETTHTAYEKIETTLREAAIVGDTIVYRGETVTSEMLKKEAERALFEKDLSSTEGMIIASGPDSAIAHHSGSGIIRPGTPIVCDFFPVSKKSGYFADMTRTYVKGRAPERVVKMYDAVLAAQDAVFEAVKPGAETRALHEAACKVFTDRGFDVGDTGFTHAIGHGLGLDVHEYPRVSKKTEERLLPGHVITVEPGLYYPDIGGVRTEDVVVVTESGFENLTNYPKIMILA